MHLASALPALAGIAVMSANTKRKVAACGSGSDGTRWSRRTGGGVGGGTAAVTGSSRSASGAKMQIFAHLGCVWFNLTAAGNSTKAGVLGALEVLFKYMYIY